MVKYFEFLRWKNLVIIFLIVFSLKYWVFETLISSTGFVQFPSSFSFVDSFLLSLSIALVAAGGYVINDINDTVADRINKDGKILLLDVLTENKAQLLYFSLTLAGIGLGTFLAYQLQLYQLVFFHLLSGGLLWIYSSYFKSSVLIGNVIVALLSALVPLCYFCFEAIAFINEYGAVFEAQYNSYFAIGPLLGFWYYAVVLSIFAFVYTLIREIIKDLEDLEGDKKLDGDTLPLAIGSGNTLWILRALIVLVVLSVLFVYYSKLQFLPFSATVFHVYVYIALIFPSLYLVRLTLKREVDYEKASKIVKIIMLFGILSAYFYHTFQ